MALNWTCPFCDRAQTVTPGRYALEGVGLSLGDHKFGNLGGMFFAIACANSECLEVTVEASLHMMGRSPDTINYQLRDKFRENCKFELGKFKLRPEAYAKVQPEYIPVQIREDYGEACLIRDKSPKASATLARRCLQGMIRNFCNIDKPTLHQEIEVLRKQIANGEAPRGVTEESIDAIDAVRSIGNIGAHMERDINVIVDVDPGEAQALIELIELLFDEWYIAQHKREARLARVTAIAVEKKLELADAKSKLLSGPDAS